MLRKFTWLLLLVAGSVLVFSFTQKFYSFQPPAGHTGDPNGNGTCANCHGNLNNGGGSVAVSGLPSSFDPGQTYSFSVTITHPSARQRWGFGISAVNANNQPVGAFASTNPNAAINGSPTELAHYNAVFSTGTSYTYSNLIWTAPSTINSGDNAVTFHLVGNAANGDGSSNGDFVYFATRLFTLPISLKQFDIKTVDEYKVRLAWTTSSESNSEEFVVEKSDDNRHFQEAGKIAAAGYSSTEKSYTFIDDKPSFFNRIVYYRLKLVDKDGKFKFSKVLQLVLKARKTYLFAVTPKHDRTGIEAGIVSENASAADAMVVGSNGAVISRQKLNLTSGRSIYNIAAKNLPSGIYYFKFQAGDVQQSVAFLVR